MKRRFISLACLAILFGQFSCGAPSRWNLNYIKSGDSEFNSSRLIYRAEDKFCGIDLEFLKTKDSIHLYLRVHSRPVSGLAENAKKAKINMECSGETYTIIASRHQGGQRLLMPESFTEIIIKLLQEGLPITFSIEGYYVKIEPARFSEFFYKMHYPPKISPSFRLPF